MNHLGPGGDLDADIDKFAKELQMPISTPLISRHVRHQSMALHISSCLVNNPIFKVPVAWRGEVLLMHRFDIMAHC